MDFSNEIARNIPSKLVLKSSQMTVWRKDQAVANYHFDIWRLQALGDVKGLTEALRDPDAVVRRRAATAMRALGTNGSIPSLQAALLQESDPDVRAAILTALEGLMQADDGTASRIVPLLARLNGSNEEHAIRAAQDLGDIQASLAVEALVITFNNSRLAPRVRLAAAEALLKLKHAPGDVTLLAALRSEKWNIRRSAAGVLGHVQADWAIPALIQALSDTSEQVRKTARAALERIGTPDALRALESATPTPPPAPPVPMTLLPPGPPQPLLLSPPAEPPLITEEDTRPMTPLPDDVGS